MGRNGHDLKQAARGRNWSERETRIFIILLQENFQDLQGRKRKAKIFDRMAAQLRSKGIERTAKEVQNKYKSITAEYRNAVAAYSKSNGSIPPSNFRWFTLLSSFMASGAAPSTCAVQDSPTSCATVFNSTISSENLSTFVVPSFPSVVASVRNDETTKFSPCQPVAPSAEFSSFQLPYTEEHTSDGFLNAGHLTDNTQELKEIAEELKQQRELSNQAHEQICASIKSFSQMIEGLSGTLSLIPNMINQLVQQQSLQPSYIPRTHATSFILSSSSQLIQQQDNNPQCLWLYHPSNDN